MLKHTKRAGARIGRAVLAPPLVVAMALAAAVVLVLTAVYVAVVHLTVQPVARGIAAGWRRIPRRVRRTAAAGTLALAATAAFAGCHQPADVVCEYYKPHASDPVTFAQWQDLPDNGGSYDRGRYLCSARHFDTSSYHHYCVYAPEHQSPPDNVWSVIGSCSF